MQTIAIHALFDANGISPNEQLTPHPRDVMSQAEVVVAIDVMSGHEALVYGRRILDRVAAGRLDRDPVVLKVALDMEIDELEHLLALVQVLKGRHEYRASA